MSAPPTGTLIVQRNSLRDIKMRDVYIHVDDLPEATLTYGKSMQVALPAGEHRIKVTNRLYSKLADFTLAEGESVVFTVANVSGGCLFAPLVIVGGAGAYGVMLERHQAGSTP